MKAFRQNISSLPHALWMAALLAALAHAPTHAAESEWAHNEGGRMRLVVTAGDRDGAYQGVLQIEPKRGWITYWREPGDSGIPPEVSIKPGSPFTIAGIDFPVPKRIDNGPVRDLGYDAPVTLPLTLQGPPHGEGGRLEAHVFIGICENICIPFTADFALDVSGDVEGEDALMIASARTRLPEKPSPAFRVAKAGRLADGKALSVDLVLPAPPADDLQVFVTGPTGDFAMEYRTLKTEPNGASLEIPLARLPEAGDPEGKTWRLLAISGGRAMETPLAFD